ncbi:MAG: GIY-YIG nuclease family protein [Candidatus Omnitrophica bacterium]|nr:GIY-YIG nuclease family protein [Candidatus Omnitrophota bacterium]
MVYELNRFVSNDKYVDKKDIIDAIRKTAKQNGDSPLGVGRFEKETGIKSYDWGKYWARFGDAQKEAGFKSNQLQIAYTDEFIIEKIIGVICKLDKFPTLREMVVEHHNDSEFPSYSVFRRLGTREQIVNKVMEYCKDKSAYDDIVTLCGSILGSSKDEKVMDESNIQIGEVYLFKSCRYYKIGKTYDTVRRGSELRIQLPEKCELIHSIKTDDPSGIEAYWHKRFETKRMNGEWFDLSFAEVKAFKLWRRIN